MSLCDQRQPYLDRSLTPEQRSAFVAHAHGCAECTRAMQAWSDTEAAIQDWAAVRQARPPTAGDTERLLVAARSRRSPAMPVWALAVAAVLLGVAILWPEPTPTAHEAAPAVVAQVERPAPVLMVLSQTGEGVGVEGTILEVPSEGHLLVALGEDRLGLGDGSRLQRRGNSGEWSLEAGTAAFEVAPRPVGELFTVVVEDHQIVVMGTRFRVDRSAGLAVTVSEGRVEIRGPDETWSVGAGQRFHNGEIIDHVDEKLQTLLQRPPPKEASLEPPTPTRRAKRVVPAPLDLDTLRRRLISGEVEPVRLELSAHLKTHSGDVDAWKLLALAENKASNSAAAAQAWLQVAERGSGATRARAHYEAALLFQGLGRHPEAVDHFQAFLGEKRRSNSLEAAGRLHLARSYVALGQTDQAVSELQTIISDHQGTSAATQARQLLKNIERR